MDRNRNLTAYPSHRSRTRHAASRSSMGGQLVLFGKKHGHLLLTKPALALLAVFMSLAVIHAGWNNHVAAAAAQTREAQYSAAILQQAKTDKFKTQVSSLIAKNPNLKIGVSVIGADGVLHNVGAQQVFDAASTAKLLTATAYLHQVELRKASLDRRIDGQLASILLQTMIVDSDDTAWASLNNYLGHPLLQIYAEQLGITDYNAESNSLAARDVAVLLYKLSSGNLLQANHAQQLLGYMHAANFRSYIIPAVDPGTQAYHKVGINDDTVNDAAILERHGKRLSLVIFTNGNGTYNWTARAILLQQITRDAQAAYL
jgi:beta-lactamase class A